MSAKHLVSMAIPSIAAWFILLQIPLVGSYQHSYAPKDGFVPDEKTAVRIAEAVLTPILWRGEG